ncbi:MAG: metallophosphoesterase, partial [Pseudomonadota bacterium]
MTRRGFLKGLLGFILAGLFAALYTFFVEPALRLRVRTWALSPKGWPTGKRLKIAIISDLHVGEPYVGLARVRQVVQRANATGADLIVLLGDYAAGHHFITRDVKIADVAPILAELNAPQGVFAILGNHDWWDDLAAQRRGGGPNLYAETLKAHGIPVLSNEAVRGDGYWIAGLEDQIAVRGPSGAWVGLDDLPGTLAQINDTDPVILLAHEPDIFATVPDRVMLTLSG